jgi:pimeloyl-ACP methyl ester carboxylesterase
MLHGMMAGAWQFELLQPYLADLGFESLALNYRGHHGSRPVAALGRVAVAELTEDALVAANSLGRPIVLGQSIGGLIAQKLAEANAVSAAALLFSLPPAGIPWRGARDMRWALDHLPAVLLGRPLQPNRKELDDLIFNRVDSAALREALFRRQVPESSKAGFEVAFGRVAVDATRVQCPILSVVAEHDRLVHPQVGEQIARKYGGDLLSFRDCGHYAIVAEPGWQARADAVASWLDRYVR